jgi:hypothetical protein
MPGIAAQGRERVEIAGVSELVEIDDAMALRNRGQHEIATDKAGATGNQKILHQHKVFIAAGFPWPQSAHRRGQTQSTARPNILAQMDGTPEKSADFS